ncbi:bifunctional folylpolyglutamate synthase/dihydrofolate synthase [Dictyoglomus thermophilum]|uniref:bifunctional folylpolyglutamate synthase/dihydrofolate synthase n=1 Tax=Dictyoglomus thermophilum TaxID=14 RepID=UPI00117D1D76|nr:folylpolyglutamate synthase/dihydrofolate synthase family protein [Dictyoglomus thermophilum]MCX7720331.1 bifunctional folylpolyglutamate synthase/dihydrofolate synthase [Dictyoglomus thermophilum]
MRKLYWDSLNYVNSFINYEKRLDNLTYEEKKFYLERMRYLLQLMGNPQDNLQAFHIAGTKGKGSTSAMIFSILKSAGYKVGLYTSPHLQSIRERIATHEGFISQEEFVDLIDYAKPYIEEAKKHPIFGSPTFFEVLTALAFLYFSMKKLDYVVIEVGLGGRLDATNVINPLISIITPIGFDHMHILGDTLEKIAFEKAGIIKEGKIVISSPQKKEAEEVIERVSRERNAVYYKVDDLFSWRKKEANLDGQKFLLEGRDIKEEFFIPLLGEHQIVNAVTAYGAIYVLKNRLNIDNEVVKKGFENVQWRGRFQIINKNPLIVVDGAHNVDSAMALKNTLESYVNFDRLFLICGIMKDKDAEKFLKILDPLVYSYNFIPLPSHRTRTPEELANIVKVFRPNAEINIYDNFSSAISFVNKKASPADLILITGSLYLAGEALDYFYGRLD